MKIVIIGNGTAGMTAAATIRKKSPETGITIVTDEKFLYYNRPALIDFMAGRKKEGELYFYPGSWYDEKKIKVLLEKSAETIELSEKCVILDDNTSLDYDKLLLATGARSNLPPIPGADTSENLKTLRCLEDAREIMTVAAKTDKIVFVGGGVLGLEAAAAVKNSFPSADILVLEVAPRLLPRQLDERGAAILAKRLAAKGLRVETGVRISSITDTIVDTGNGKIFEAGLIVVSAGVIPNVEPAAAGGIKTAKGIVVDEYMRTSAPDVYAAGDCVEHDGRLWGIVPAAVEHGRVAAENIINHGSARYKGTAMSNTLKVAGIDLTTEGDISGEDAVTRENSDEERGIYKKIFVRNGVLVGSMCLGDAGGAKKISAAGRSGQKLTDKEAEELIH